MRGRFFCSSIYLFVDSGIAPPCRTLVRLFLLPAGGAGGFRFYHIPPSATRFATIASGGNLVFDLEQVYAGEIRQLFLNLLLPAEDRCLVGTGGRDSSLVWDPSIV